MMRGWIGAGAAALLLAVPTSAGATVIGALDPTGKDPGVGDYCVATNANYLQAGVAPGDPSYTVPIGGGTITSWSTKYGLNGATVGLEVWRAGALEGEYKLVALDSQTIARNAEGISTFLVSIPVQAGDVLGIQQPVANTTDCAFVQPQHNVNSFDFAYFGTPAVGSTVNFDESNTVFASLLNVTATVQQSADLGVAETVTPASVHVGDVVQLLLTVSNAGPAPSPATVSDMLPAGLTAISAVAQNGTCTLGSTVSCQLSMLPAAASSTIVINAQATNAGTGTNEATISGLSTNVDPNSANNAASGTVTVLATETCTVPKLKGLTLSKAKKLLASAHCALGKVKKPHHHHGTLVVVSQGSAAGKVEAAGSQVAVKLGRKHKHRHKHKHA